MLCRKVLSFHMVIDQQLLHTRSAKFHIFELPTVNIRSLIAKYDYCAHDKMFRTRYGVFLTFKCRVYAKLLTYLVNIKVIKKIELTPCDINCCYIAKSFSYDCYVRTVIHRRFYHANFSPVDRSVHTKRHSHGEFIHVIEWILTSISINVEKTRPTTTTTTV